MSEATERFETWAILELFGHRKLAGRVTEQEIAGQGFVRLDIPAEGDEPKVTQFYNPTAVYGLTPVTEETARAVAKDCRPRPIHEWDARRLLADSAGDGESESDLGHDPAEDLDDSAEMPL